MPGGDRTGPRGEGPMTGRGMGYCAEGSATPMRGAFGMGQGRGFGRGRGFARTIPANTAPLPQELSKEQQMKNLEQQKVATEERLKEIERQLEDLKK